MLNKKYNGIYITKMRIDIGNNQFLPIKTKVRIYFRSTSKFIAVYGYNENANREYVFGKNILILIKSDFEDKIFSINTLEKELNLILKGI